MGSLKTRLTLVAVVPLLGLLLVSLLAMSQLRSANEAMASIYRDRVVPLRQLKQVSDAFAVDLIDQTHKLRDGSVDWEAARRRLAATRGIAASAWEEYLTTYLVERERHLIEQIRPRLAAVHLLADDLDAILARRDAQALGRFAAVAMYPVVDPLTKVLNELSQVQLDEARDLHEGSEAAFKKLQALMGAGLALVLGCVSLFAWLVSRSTVMWLGRATRAAASVAQGEITEQIDATAEGEVGALLSAIESIRRELSCSMEEMVQLLTIVPVPMLSADTGAQDRVREANPAFERYFGVSREAIVGRRLEDLPIWFDGVVAENWRRHRMALEAGTQWQGRAELTTRNGRGEASSCEVSTMVSRHERSSVMLAAFEDVTVRRAQERAWQDQALRDGLTGLANRAFVEQALSKHWAAWRRHQRPFAVVQIDLDGFKPINDALGHAAGDEVLVEVGRRLSGVCRAGDTCGRWGGDEFVLVLDSCHDLDQALEVAHRALTEFSDPVVLAADGPALWGGRPPCTVGASIGVAHSADEGCDDSTAADVLARADRLMYAAKAAGKNRVEPSVAAARR